MSASGVETSGLGAPLRTATADTGLREVGAAGQDLTLFDEIVDRVAVDHDHVGRLAAAESPRHGAGWAVTHGNGISAGMLERRHELDDRRLHGGRDQRMNFIGLRCGRHDKQRGRDCGMRINVPPFSLSQGPDSARGFRNFESADDVVFMPPR